MNKKVIYMITIIAVVLAVGKFYNDYKFATEHPIQSRWNYLNGDSNWYFSLGQMLNSSSVNNNPSSQESQPTQTNNQNNGTDTQTQTDSQPTNQTSDTQTETPTQDQNNSSSLLEDVQNELYDLSSKGYYCDWKSISGNTPQIVYLNGKESHDKNSDNYAMDIQYALNHNIHVYFDDNAMKKISYIDTKEFKN